MAEVKAFRWRGPGVLHIKGRPDGKLVVVPPYEPGEIEHACIVKDPVNIAALGQERVVSLIKAGSAEPITWVDGIKGFVREDAKESLTLQDVQASEEQLQPTAEFEASVQKENLEKAATMTPADRAAAEHELRRLGEIAATAQVATSGTLAGGPKAGPDRS
jgi:hypothetical protein